MKNKLCCCRYWFRSTAYFRSCCHITEKSSSEVDGAQKLSIDFWSTVVQFRRSVVQEVLNRQEATIQFHSPTYLYVLLSINYLPNSTPCMHHRISNGPTQPNNPNIIGRYICIFLQTGIILV